MMAHVPMGRGTFPENALAGLDGQLSVHVHVPGVEVTFSVDWGQEHRLAVSEMVSALRRCW
jgi:hypothetical protein